MGSSRDNRKIIAMFVGVLTVCLAVLLLVFSGLITRYRSNVTFDSSSNLAEISTQAAFSIEGTIQQDEKFAESIALSFQNGSFANTAEMLQYLDQQRQVWDVGEICLYADDGTCYNQSGIAQNRDTAAAFAYRIVKNGTVFEMDDSSAVYGVAVRSDLTVDGKKIVAISATRDLNALIDDRGFRPFGGEAYIYLTRQNGVKLSQSTTNDAPVVFNVSSLFAEGSLECISQSDLTLDQAMQQGNESVFLYTDSRGVVRYAVLTPVKALNETWYLFSLVPVATVNQTMDNSLDYIMRLTVVVLVVFAVLMLVFFLVYRARANRYVKDMRERERLLDLLVTNTDTAFLLLSDRSELPIYVSSNADRVLGTAYPHVGQSDGHLRLTEADGVETTTLAGVNEALASWDGKSDLVSEYIPYRRGSEPRYMALRLYPARERQGEYIGIAQDVTTERQRREELRSALAMADSANQAKTRFLSNMSHDIRTPMNAIVNMTRFALADVDNPVKVRGYLEIVQNSSDHLLQLINDVLDMSRIESGELALSAEAFDLMATVDSVCEIIRPLCIARDQTFSCDRKDIVHPQVMGDALRVQQVLINLLNNAVKFTPAGGAVALTVTELQALKKDTACFKFDVRDSGIGMDDETIAKAFQPFVRSEDAAVTKIEGSGLGLSITHNIVEAMGGSISVQSQLGHGSLFSVQLFFPLAQHPVVPRADVEPESDEVRFDGKRVLLVEDNEINQTIACMILERWGMDVDVASDGRDALGRIARVQQVPYDIIYMDIQMPKMNGYDASRAIRQCGVAGCETVPIVAMTANVFAEDIERARQAGMNGHVGKPIDSGELKAVTTSLLGTRTEGEADGDEPGKKD